MAGNICQQGCRIIGDDSGLQRLVKQLGHRFSFIQDDVQAGDVGSRDFH